MVASDPINCGFVLLTSIMDKSIICSSPRPRSAWREPICSHLAGFSQGTLLGNLVVFTSMTRAKARQVRTGSPKGVDFCMGRRRFGAGGCVEKPGGEKNLKVRLDHKL